MAWRDGDDLTSFNLNTQGSFGTVLNVQAFGAVGDGATDDTGAFRSSMSSAASLGGAIVYAPPGTYLYEHLSVWTNCTLQGAGPQRTILQRKSTLSTSGESRLFGVRLQGNFACLRDLSVKGQWDNSFSTATNQTYDINVAVVGDSVEHVRCINVESYNAHIGFLVGGLVGSSANGNSWGGQNFARFENCYGHDTYDLNFGLIARGRADADTCAGCAIVNSVASSCRTSAGIEIRYQRAAQVADCYSRGHSNADLGAGLRLEETDHAIVTNLQTAQCTYGLQGTNNSHSCLVNGFVARNCTLYGAQYYHCSDMQLSNFLIDKSGDDGILLTWASSTWTRNNERLAFVNGRINEVGTAYAAGIRVEGASTNTSVQSNGRDLVIDGVHVFKAYAKGIEIQAGGNFSITNCVLEDNGVGVTDGHGIIATAPLINGTDTILNVPSGGFIHGCMFINNSSVSSQVYAVNDATYITSASSQPLTVIGDVRTIGTHIWISTAPRRENGVFQNPIRAAAGVYAAAGSATNPMFAFSSESSLGFYRSNTSTVGLTYGRLALPTAAPANASATGDAGQVSWGVGSGTTFLYLCHSTNSWGRVAVAPW